MVSLQQGKEGRVEVVSEEEEAGVGLSECVLPTGDETGLDLLPATLTCSLTGLGSSPFGVQG